MRCRLRAERHLTIRIKPGICKQELYILVNHVERVGLGAKLSEWDGKLKTSSYAEFGSRGNAGHLGKRIAGSQQLSAADAAKLTVKAWLAGTDGWNPER